MQYQERMNPSQFMRMIHYGYEELQAKKEEVNALNVFPVPDGDTGTNMYLSFSSGIREMEKLSSDAELGKIVEALALGLLMGARGNSGVILSQLFRGFQLVCSGCDEITPELLARALSKGVETAYKAVARPVEGTILTVAREAAASALKVAKKPQATLVAVLEAAIRAGEVTLQKTTEMLPALTQAGVVDSGGQGLVHIYKGFMRNFIQEDDWELLSSERSMRQEPLAYAAAEVHGQGEYGYCTEFLLKVDESEHNLQEVEANLKRELLTLGDSLLIVSTSSIVKVHVHTLAPGLALQAGLAYGSLLTVKIDNMTEQYQALTTQEATLLVKSHQDAVQADPVPQPCGLVVVVAGEGLTDIFHSLHVDAVVSGGQTMNPSTKEILQAVEQVQAHDVFILPNNSNIFMAAQQVEEVTHGRAKMLPTESIGAGFAAALAFDKSASAKDNEAAMQDAVEKIHSGAITASVRDSTMDDHVIKQGEYMGLADGQLLIVNPIRETVLQSMLEHFCQEGAEICTVFYAQEALSVEAQTVVDNVSLRYSDVEFEVRYGGQPVYEYLLASE